MPESGFTIDVDQNVARHNRLARALVHGKRDFVLDEFPEAGLFGGQRVPSGLHRGKLVVAVAVGFRRLSDSRIEVRQGQAGVCDGGFLRIFDRSDQRRVLGEQGHR